MTYVCMSPDELALWRTGAANVRSRASSPCVDCPMAFHLEMKAAGRCNSKPLHGRPILDDVVDAMVDERRRQWREAATRRRQRTRAA